MFTLFTKLSIIQAQFKARPVLITCHSGKKRSAYVNWEVETINSEQRINMTWRCVETPIYSVLSGALNGTICLPGQNSIFSKNLTGATPSKPSVKITFLSDPDKELEQNMPINNWKTVANYIPFNAFLTSKKIKMLTSLSMPGN